MKKNGFIIIGIIIILVLVFTIIKVSDKPKGTPNTDIKDQSVLDHDYYKGLTLENVTSVTIIKATVAGVTEKEYNSKKDIKRYYNYWKNKKLGKKVKYSCEDNTTTYVFNLENNATIAIEKECDWIVINNERYLIK